MLKQRSIASVTALVCVASISNGSLPMAQAAITDMSAVGDNLIAKDRLPSAKAPSQAELNGIYRSLTAFYGGLNERSISRMERGAHISGEVKKVYQDLFDLVRYVRADISVEVTNINLVSYSNAKAVVDIDTVTRSKTVMGMKATPQKALVGLIKQNGQWRIMPDRQEDIEQLKQWISSMKAALNKK